MRAWLRRWGGNPVASVVLVAALVGDAFTLPRDSDQTPVASVVEAVFFSRPMRCYFPAEVYVIQTPERMKVVDPEEESWDELATALSGGTTPVAVCDLRYDTRRLGLWSQVVQTERSGISIQPVSGAWSEAQHGAAREALFDERTRSLACWELIEAYESNLGALTRTTKVLWGGVLNDLLVVLLLAGLAYSFAGWPAWFASHPLSRRSRRLARGQCADCGYDLRGLDTGVCPECGHAATRG